MLTDQEIKQLQEIYYKNFGKKINQKESLDMGVKLVTLITSISKSDINKNKKSN